MSAVIIYLHILFKIIKENPSCIMYFLLAISSTLRDKQQIKAQHQVLNQKAQFVPREHRINHDLSTYVII